MVSFAETAKTLRKGVVDLVNPKFHKYSKPLMITILVALPTAAVTAALFFAMVTDCKNSVQINDGWHGHEELTKTAPTCVFFYDILVNHQVTGQPVFQACSSVDQEVDGKSYKAPSVPICDGIEAPSKAVAECPWGNNGKILKYSYKQCPAAMSTLGAALGYSAFIELVFTIVVLGVLTQSGFIEKDGTYFRELLDQVVEEKGTGKEICIEAGVVG
eukprot:TRINITY_DN365_c0_g1_i1.p1 TRINITY_DN365_c0_g1~~TRINITY_DN365_c0_g1_i1.p1  ORF type:complete len:237 (-),score=56.11 TRINITY_DN365_c0_g1_i1:377-1024(-)